MYTASISSGPLAYGKAFPKRGKISPGNTSGIGRLDSSPENRRQEEFNNRDA
jgi:hypothetical protein